MEKGPAFWAQGMLDVGGTTYLVNSEGLKYDNWRSVVAALGLLNLDADGTAFTVKLGESQTGA